MVLGTSEILVGVWDTGEESGIVVEEFNRDRGEDLVDLDLVDMSIGKDGGDGGGDGGGGWCSCDLVMVRSTGASEGRDVS